MAYQPPLLSRIDVMALTPQCALDDLEVRDVAQEVGRARRIGVEGACGTAVRGAVSSTVCGRVAVRVGRDGVRGGRAVQGDLNHLRVVGRLGGAVLAGAHLVSFLWEAGARRARTASMTRRTMGTRRVRELLVQNLTARRLFKNSKNLT